MKLDGYEWKPQCSINWKNFGSNKNMPSLNFKYSTCKHAVVSDVLEDAEALDFDQQCWGSNPYHRVPQCGEYVVHQVVSKS